MKHIVRKVLIYDIIGFLAYKAIKRNTMRRKRRWWVRKIYQERDSLGFYETTFQTMKREDPEMFIKATRMNVDRFELLLSLVRKRLEKSSMRKPISAECRLLATVMYLAHGGSRNIYAWKFRMSTSTFGKIIKETSQAIWDELSGIYLSPPNSKEWQDIAYEFGNRWRLPNCLGAIDGKHVTIVCPPKGGSQYFNYKGHHSVVLLAVCDARYCFTMVDIGAYGSQSDGGILSESSFGQLLLNDKLHIPHLSTLPNSNKELPYFFVGDSAFPLRYNLMRPYPGNNFSPKKEYFNKRVSQARVTIENAFGIMAARWRILRHDIHAAPENVDRIVKAIVVLHNFLMLTSSSYCPSNYGDNIVEGELIEGQWRGVEGAILNSVRMSRSYNATREAFNVREKLCTYLFRNKNST